MTTQAVLGFNIHHGLGNLIDLRYYQWTWIWGRSKLYFSSEKYMDGRNTSLTEIWRLRKLMIVLLRKCVHMIPMGEKNKTSQHSPGEYPLSWWLFLLCQQYDLRECYALTFLYHLDMIFLKTFLKMVRNYKSMILNNKSWRYWLV